MSYSVVTFKPSEDAIKCEEFERFRDLYIHENPSENSKLYSRDTYKTEELLAVSLAYMDDIPYGASSLFYREHFPKCSARCVNRFFVLKDFRFGGSQYRNLQKLGLGQPRNPVISVEMAYQQSQIASAYGFNFCFISRELPNRQWCEAMTTGLTNRSGNNWMLNKEVVAVCNETSFSCWQHVIYSDLKQQGRAIEFKLSAPEHVIYERFNKTKFLHQSL